MPIILGLVPIYPGWMGLDLVEIRVWLRTLYGTRKGTILSSVLDFKPDLNKKTLCLKTYTSSLSFLMSILSIKLWTRLRVIVTYIEPEKSHA